MTQFDSDDGQKFLVTRMTIENRGSEAIDLTPRLFIFESSGVQYSHRSLMGSQGIGDVTLNPGAMYDGWVVFSIPETTTEGTLTATGEAYFQTTIAVEFQHDPEMAINMSL